VIFSTIASVASWHLGCTRWLDRRADELKGVDVAKEDRGFASMDRVKQKEIASKGGKAAHQKGTAHEWTSEEARDAGRKGGLASHRRRREQQDGVGGDEPREVTGVNPSVFTTGGVE
jgi:general stress protein YciG